MARAVIGGLVTSSLLTLIVVPVVYTFFDDFGGKISGWFTRSEKEHRMRVESRRTEAAGGR
jgi:HAE1 family hydrophobic/amphiphilic exporter-1